MSLVVNTNVGALDAYRNLSKNQMQQQDAMSKLSSGLRINKASDDAAGLSISQGLTSQINGLTVAARNAQDGINVAQIADSALGTTQQVLQRMRDLAVQANNTGTNDANSLGAIKSEMDSLASTVDNIANGTKFGGTALLDGTYSGKTFQVGSGTGSTDTLSFTLTSSSATTLGVNGLDVTAAGGATTALTAIDTAIQTVSSSRADIGAFQNTLNYTISNLQSTIQNVSASRSNITDADLAVEVTKMTQSQILAQAATSVLAQANSAPQAVLKLLQ